MTEATFGTAPATRPLVAANGLVVASGKGGVGKTWLAITLAHALARRGRRILLVDGDLGLANIDIQLGVGPEHDLHGVMAGRLPLASAITRLDGVGFDLVAGRSGSGSLASAAPEAVARLRGDLVALADRYDAVIVDLAAGLDRAVRLLAGGGRTLLVVVTGEPTSLTDAYALIKLLVRAGEPARPAIVVNRARGVADGRRTYDTLRRVCESYLGLSPELAGIVRDDDRVSDSIRGQAPLLERYPNCRAAEDVLSLAAWCERRR